MLSEIDLLNKNFSWLCNTKLYPLIKYNLFIVLIVNLNCLNSMRNESLARQSGLNQLID